MSRKFTRVFSGLKFPKQNSTPGDSVGGDMMFDGALKFHNGSGWKTVQTVTPVTNLTWTTRGNITGARGIGFGTPLVAGWPTPMLVTAMPASLYCYYSIDGITWLSGAGTVGSVLVSPGLLSFAFGNNRFIYVPGQATRALTYCGW